MAEPTSVLVVPNRGRTFIESSARIFDRLQAFAQGHAAQRIVGRSLVVVFVGMLAAIELARAKALPPHIAEHIPTANHFFAIDFCFGLLLAFEAIALVFSLARSVSDAMGMQIEIFSLILLRKSFKECTTFQEPIIWNDALAESVAHMASDACGALAIFAALGLYYRMQLHYRITSDDSEQASFIAAKKFVGLLLLLGMGLIGAFNVWRWAGPSEELFLPFFDAFFTLLIFSDVLLVLISLRYSSTFRVAFRNSGFAVATIFLRVALVAPPFLNAAMGLGTTLYSLGLTVAYNRFGILPRQAGSH